MRFRARLALIGGLWFGGLVPCVVGSAEAAIPAAERNALLALYESTGGGTDWKGLRWEGPPGTEGTWYGVIVENDHVVQLDLVGLGLNGPIPPEIAALSELRILDLSGYDFVTSYAHNVITGIAPEIGQLSRLEVLDLEGVRLESVPEEIGQLSSLRELDLGGNLLADLPDSVGLLQNLRTLTLFSNQLTHLPESLGMLQNLQTLDVGDNQLLSLPDSLGDLSSLESLGLSNNPGLVDLPVSLGSLSSLTALGVSGMGWTSLPSSVTSISSLESLSLGGNPLVTLSSPTASIAALTHLRVLSLRDCTLESLPPEIGDLAQLETLILTGTPLESLPPEITSLRNLSRLDLEKSALRTLPEGMGEMSLLTSLDLDDTQFVEFPADLGSWRQFQSITARRTQLAGPIPAALGEVAALETLDLSDNRLEGSIPPELSSLDRLRVLNLAGNLLSGPLPAELGLIATLTDLILSDNQLSGAVPESVAALPLLRRLDAHLNRLAGPVPVPTSSHMNELDLSDNDLSGTIPLGLGSREINTLDLSRNHLTGPIPPELWSSDVWGVYLSGNLLSGKVPPWPDSGPFGPRHLDLRWNLLFAGDAEFRARLEELMDGEFANTQTRPPGRIIPVEVSGTWADVRWYKPAYVADAGGYEVAVAVDPRGPYEIEAVTSSKEISAADVRGLKLATPYFVRVRTVTHPHAGNQNELCSNWSEMEPLMTLDETQQIFPMLTLGSPDFTGLAVSNQMPQSAWVEFAAFQTDGLPVPGRRNPVELTLPGGSQLALLGEELFQPDSADETDGWVEVTSDAEAIGGLFLVGQAGALDGLPATPYPARRLYWPSILSGNERGAVRTVQIRIVNPEPELIAVRFQLIGSSSDPEQAGPAVRTVSRILPPHGLVVTTAEDLFGNDLGVDHACLRADVLRQGTVPDTGRMAGMAWVEFGSGRSVAAFPAQEAGSVTTLYSAQLASTPELVSLLCLVNTSGESRTVHLRFVEDDGTVSSTASFEADPGQVIEKEAGDWFGWDEAGHVGSLVVDCGGIGLIGQISFLERSAAESAAGVPLLSAGKALSVFDQLAQNSEIFTGLALFNPGAEPVNVTVAAFSQSGGELGSATVELGAGCRTARLLDQLLPGAVGQVRGYIRVMASAPIVAQQIFGDYAQTYLATVPPRP